MDQTEQKTVPHFAQYSPYTVRLIEWLKNGKIGDEYTDDHLKEVSGLDCSPGGRGYSHLQSAIRHVERENLIAWRRMPGQNKIRCLNPSEIANESECKVKSISRQAKRQSRRLSLVKISDVPESDRTRYTALTAQIGTIALMSSGRTRRAIESRGAREVNHKDVLEFFGSK
jgi:hypothetical protein